MDYGIENITTNYSSKATLTYYVQSNSDEIDINKVRPAIIICPGGGFDMLSDREAEPIAIQMLARGFNAFILHYTIKPATFPKPTIELATAVGIVRQNAKQWHIDTNKVVVAGFSAGGHVAASLGVYWNSDFIKNELPSGMNCQPNGMMLAYPVVSAGKYGHQGSIDNLKVGIDKKYLSKLSLEENVTAQTPALFAWHTNTDDLVPVENTLLFAQALRKYQIPTELHIFPKGGHGLSLGTKETALLNGYGIQSEITGWPDLFAKWVEELS